MNEPTQPDPKSFSPSKILLLLTLLLLPLLGWFLYQRWERQKIENHVTYLEPMAFQPLPLGSVKPAGWLLDQLQLQASGLSGHLDEFWPDVENSGWIGGKAEGWERGPYWLDGVVPLAYLTGYPRLLAKVRRWMDYILSHQLPDGWLGPEQSPPPTGAEGAQPPDPRDPWPQFIILKVLAQYEEASGDARVIPAMEKSFRSIDYQLDRRPLFAWNFFRWGDGVLSLLWLYDRVGEPWMLNLSRKIANQGYNWPRHFSDLPVKEKSQGWNWDGHVVNNAMGLKAPGLLWRMTGDNRFKKSSLSVLSQLDRYHGEPNGLFSGDECLAGRNPSQGTELCAIVETMFSLENEVAMMGDVKTSDRLEKIAFNALPAAFSPDYWGHQYDEQSNQIVSQFNPRPIYTTNSGTANLFGLEPQYGCCTANMHQGWPKFASHLWMGTPDQGLAAVAYAPSVVETALPGGKVRVELTTDYPFNETLTFKVSTGAGLEFPLYLRVPEWAKGATLKLPDGKVETLSAGTFHQVRRKWSGEEVLVLNLPMAFQVREWYQDSVSVERGPLVYSLGLKENWKRARPFPYQPKGDKKYDYGVFPESPWNYALELDKDHPDKSLVFTAGAITGNPFGKNGPPVKVTVKGKRLMDWTYAQGAALPPPQSPVVSSSPEETLELVPYGTTRLRVTAFPVLKQP